MRDLVLGARGTGLRLVRPLPRRPPSPAREREPLDGAAVLRQGFRLYRRLLAKTLAVSLLVFAPLQAAVACAFALGAPPPVVALVALSTAFGGLGFLQAALVEIVWDQHEDGAHDTSLREVARRFRDRAGRVAVVSLPLFLPGLALAGRRLLTVPVLVLDDLRPRRALAHARELAAPDEFVLLRVALLASFAALVLQAPFLVLAALDGRTLTVWLVGVAAAALTMPYLAHSSIVAYYALTQPHRPIVLDPGESRPGRLEQPAAQRSDT